MKLQGNADTASLVLMWEDEDGVALWTEIPSVIAVCERCCGRGKHDPQGFDDGFTQEDFDADPDFAEEYRAGRYEVTCTECGGRRVHRYVDRLAIAKLDEDAEARQALEHLDWCYRQEAADAHTRWMESGGRF